MRPPAVRLRPRDRRALTVGAVMLVAAWLGTRAIPSAVRAASELRHRTTERVEELARAREALASEPWARESLVVRAQRLVAWAPRLLAGVSSGDARVELASFAGGMAALRHVRIARQDALPDSAAGLFTEVALRLQAEGDVEGIAAWLASLEEGPKLIAVREVTLTAPEPASPATQAERLAADVVIASWTPRVEKRK